MTNRDNINPDSNLNSRDRQKARERKHYYPHFTEEQLRPTVIKCLASGHIGILWLSQEIMLKFLSHSPCFNYKSTLPHKSSTDLSYQYSMLIAHILAWFTPAAKLQKSHGL